MEYSNLKDEIHRIKLNQSLKVMKFELLKQLELLGAKMTVKNSQPTTSPPVEISEAEDMSYTIVDVMESMTSLTVYEEVTLP
jgi:hypothetical protein